jgi:hypothetical protein
LRSKYAGWSACMIASYVSHCGQRLYEEVGSSLTFE